MFSLSANTRSSWQVFIKTIGQNLFSWVVCSLSAKVDCGLFLNVWSRYLSVVVGLVDPLGGTHFMSSLHGNLTVKGGSNERQLGLLSCVDGLLEN